MSVRDLLADMARDHAAEISPEYRSYRSACRAYHEAAMAVTAHRNEAETWKVRENNARKRLAKIVEEFEAKGWMLP
jgi:hypothetical protein